MTGPAPDAVNQPISYDEQAAQASAVAAVTEDLQNPSKRSLSKRGVNDPCAPQPDGYGPKASPDTPDAFLSADVFSVCSFHSLCSLSIRSISNSCRLS